MGRRKEKKPAKQGNRTTALEDAVLNALNVKASALERRSQWRSPLDHVAVGDCVLLPRQCEALRLVAETAGFSNAFQRETRDMAYRKCGRIQFESHRVAAQLFELVKAHVPATLDDMELQGCNENIRIYSARGLEGGDTVFYSEEDWRTQVLSVEALPGR
ncbi:MAG: hypothetical protein MHM6MM_002412 [Cercozoa sp. M6MM]